MATQNLTSFDPVFVPTYSDAVYIYGVRRLTARDGKKGIPSAYLIPVMTYAANNYEEWQFQNAIDMNYITQQEYDETMQYKNKL